MALNLDKVENYLVEKVRMGLLENAVLRSISEISVTGNEIDVGFDAQIKGCAGSVRNTVLPGLHRFAVSWGTEKQLFVRYQVFRSHGYGIPDVSYSWGKTIELSAQEFSECTDDCLVSVSVQYSLPRKGGGSRWYDDRI